MAEDSMKGWTGSILCLREEVTDSDDSTWSIHCLVVRMHNCNLRVFCGTLQYTEYIRM